MPFVGFFAILGARHSQRHGRRFESYPRNGVVPMDQDLFLMLLILLVVYKILTDSNGKHKKK